MIQSVERFWKIENWDTLGPSSLKSEKTKMSSRKFLTIKEKIELIEYKEQHDITLRQLAIKFKIGRTQVNAIVKNKEEIRKLYVENGNSLKKRVFPKRPSAAIDKLVFEWFCEVRNKNIAISGRIIKEKALEVAKELNIAFKASNGWLDKFCQRHSIALKSCKEGNFKENEVDEWKKKLVSAIDTFSPNNDIFNTDETGLMYDALVNKTFPLKTERLYSDSDEDKKTDTLESDGEEDEVATNVSNIFEAHCKLRELESFFVTSGDLIATEKVIELLSHVEWEIIKSKSETST